MGIGVADGTSIQIGAHTLTREGQVLHVVTRGTLSLSDVNQLAAHYESSIAQQGFALVLAYMEKGTDMPMHARRAASEWGSTHGHRTRTAVYGATFFLRNALQLINRASHVLKRHPPNLGFFATEREAREWLIEQIPALTGAARKS